VGVAHPVHHRAICDMESLIQRSSHPLDLSSLMISGAGGHHRSRLNRAFDDEGGDERRTGPISPVVVDPPGKPRPSTLVTLDWIRRAFASSQEALVKIAGSLCRVHVG